MGLACNFIDSHTQIYTQLVGWQYVNVLIITHSAAVKFIACPVQKSQIFADLPHGTNVYVCVCVCVCKCNCVCVCCVVVLPLRLLILYSNFRLMHMTLIRLHPVEKVSQLVVLQLLLVYHCHTYISLFFLKHYIYLPPLLNPWLPPLPLANPVCLLPA